MDEPEQCPRCKTLGIRQFCPQRLHLTRTAVQHAEFNPGLGKVIQNKRHLDDVLKQHHDKTGVKLHAIGNDYKSPETLHKEGDRDRAEMRAKRWAEASEKANSEVS